MKSDEKRLGDREDVESNKGWHKGNRLIFCIQSLKKSLDARI